MRRVYLDYAATTPIDPDVLAEIVRVYEQLFGNPSSLHTYGQEARKIVEESRKTLASILNAKPEEIIFTSGGSESDNLAIKGVAFRNRERGKHLITSAIEHAAVLDTMKYLEKSHGFELTVLPVDQYGTVSPESVEEAIRPNTILVSIMYANNEIGTIQPIEGIGKVCQEHDVIFHTDAVQAFCKVPIDVQAQNIDLLSTAAHKVYGPKGVGFLFVRDIGIRKNWGLYIDPLIHGGGHEFGLRSGTENAPGIAGFAKAADLLYQDFDNESQRQTILRDKIIQRVTENIEDVTLNGHPTQRLPNNVNLSIANVEGESLLLALHLEGIAVSTASACSSKSAEPSHVLTALGIPAELARGSLRITLGKYTTEEEVNYLLEKLGPIVARLRGLSPLGGETGENHSDS